jgi:DnaB-like helicase C terminal domain
MPSSLDKILLKLSKVQRSHTGGFVACCPAHEDHSPSFSIKEEVNGKILFYCYAGCSFEAICHALDLAPQDINPAPTNAPQRIRYEIRDLEGNLVSSHVRRDTPDGKLISWDPPLKPMGLSLRDVPFYRSQDIPRFDPNRWVYLTEGEKCCDLLRNNFGTQALGTVTGAASQHDAQVFASLKGLKVALWPDNDVVGQTHMQKARVLATSAGAAQLVMLNPKEMELSREGDDAEQWIEQQRATRSHQELAQLLEACQFPKTQVLKEAPPTQAPPEEEPTFVSLESLLPVSLLRLEKRATGEEKPVPLPFPHIAQSFGGGLWAGAHYIVGTTGSGKTQIALEFAKYASIKGYPALYIALELGEMDLVSRLVTPPPHRWSETFLGRLPTNAWPDLVNRANAMKTWPLYFEFGDPYGWPYTRLLRSVEQLRQKHPDGPLLVVLDFLQLVGDESLTNPRIRPMEPRARVGAAAYMARQCAKNYGVSMLLLSSTARNNYGQLSATELPEGLASDGRVTEPMKFIGTAKESGDVEFSGDTVTAIVKAPFSMEKERYLLVTAKSRYGAPRWAELHFDGSNFSIPDVNNSLEAALRDREAASKKGGFGDY